MSDPKRCERCGGVLPEAGILHGCCPRCMVEMGLEPASGLRNSEIISTRQEGTNVVARPAVIGPYTILRLIGADEIGTLWRHIDMLGQALELDTIPRAAFLDRACAGEEELRRKM